jgi:hypothetical protein
MVQYHEIIHLDTGKQEFRQGEFKGLHITAETSHNKNITRIMGLEQFGFDPHLKAENNPNSFQCLINYF